MESAFYRQLLIIGRQKASMRGLLNLLVGFAFVVRSLLPVGFMLAVPPAPAAAVEIVICLGHGPQSLTLDDQGVPLPAKAPMSGKNICPYAAAGAVARTCSPTSCAMRPSRTE